MSHMLALEGFEEPAATALVAASAIFLTERYVEGYAASGSLHHAAITGLSVFITDYFLEMLVDKVDVILDKFGLGFLQSVEVDVARAVISSIVAATVSRYFGGALGSVNPVDGGGVKGFFYAVLYHMAFVFPSEIVSKKFLVPSFL